MIFAPNGSALVANVMASVAGWERDVIGRRTREALRARRVEGVTLGRPKRIPPEVTARIKRWRRRGLSLPKIADKLSPAPTSTGRCARSTTAGTRRSRTTPRPGTRPWRS